MLDIFKKLWYNIIKIKQENKNIKAVNSKINVLKTELQCLNFGLSYSKFHILEILYLSKIMLLPLISENAQKNIVNYYKICAKKF